MPSKHVQFFAGTDTSYNPTLVKDGGSYDEFETLTKAFQDVISDETDVLRWHAENQSELAKPAASKIGDEVSAVYVNGPDTLGHQIGQLLFEHLKQVLIALEHGTTDFVFVGHSRGACAAMIVSHDLQTLKNFKPKTLQAFCETLYTQDVDQKLLQNYLKKHNNKAFFERLDFSKIVENAAYLKIQLCLIDPVPGGSWHGTKNMTAWRDSRFYSLPECVERAQIYLAKHERSRCFKVVLPKASAPEKTYIEFLPMPAHHGTMSGNLSVQVRTELNETTMTALIPHTKKVQTLAYHSIRQFLESCGVALKHTTLSPSQTLTLYREIYQAEKDKAFDSLSQHTYGTGKEQSLWGWLPGSENMVGIKDERIVRIGPSSEIYLTGAVPELPNAMNMAHVRLELAQAFGLFADSENTDAYRSSGFFRPDASPSHLLRTFMIALEDDNKVKALSTLSKEARHSLVDAVFGNIALRYLKNHLMESDKQALIQTIGEFFTRFCSSESELHQRAVLAIQDAIQARVRTLTEEALALIQAIDCLNREAQKKNDQIACLLDGGTSLLERLNSFSVDSLAELPEVIQIDRPQISSTLNKLKNKILTEQNLLTSHLSQTNAKQTTSTNLLQTAKKAFVMGLLGFVPSMGLMLLLQVMLPGLGLVVSALVIGAAVFGAIQMGFICYALKTNHATECLSSSSRPSLFSPLLQSQGDRPETPREIEPYSRAPASQKPPSNGFSSNLRPQ